MPQTQTEPILSRQIIRAAFSAQCFLRSIFRRYKGDRKARQLSTNFTAGAGIWVAKFARGAGTSSNYRQTINKSPANAWHTPVVSGAGARAGAGRGTGRGLAPITPLASPAQCSHLRHRPERRAARQRGSGGRQFGRPREPGGGRCAGPLGRAPRRNRNTTASHLSIAKNSENRTRRRQRGAAWALCPPAC